ncbi:MAG: hypothetical protein AB7S74_02155 [Hyphomicrobium sp.]
METVWAVVVLVLVAALVYGAYSLGRASAFAEMRRMGQDTGQPTPISDAPVPSTRTNLPRTAQAPPVFAGGDGPSSATSASSKRSAAPPPAAASGPSSSGQSGSSHAQTPRRTAAPPPAAAAWSTPKSGSNSDDA